MKATLAPKHVKTEDREQKLDLLKRTHEIFVGLHGKEISLTSCSPPGRTDTETFVAIPLDDPECDLVHKHEWQHIFFKTNLRARAVFVDQYSAMVLAGVPVRKQGALKPQLEGFLNSFCNGVDDIRVASLWHKIYPQSAEDIEERWKRVIREYRIAGNDITFYVMGVALGLTDAELGSTKWVRWRSLIEAQMATVKGSGFPSVLIAARVILNEVLQDVMKDFYEDNPAQRPPPQDSGGTNPPGPGGGGGGQQGPSTPQEQKPSRLSSKPNVTRSPEAAKTSRPVAPSDTPAEKRKESFLTDMIMTASPSTKDVRFADTPSVPAGLDPRSYNTQSVVQAALGVASKERIDLVVQLANKEMERILQAFRVSAPKMSADQRMLKGLDSTTRFVDIKPKDVDAQELSEEDKRLVSTMRRLFLRLADKKRRTRSDEGSTLDPISYFEMQMGSNDGDIFEDEVSTKGFSALVVLDMSGSMKPHWDLVARAALVLAKGLKFPFSKFEVWGFSSNATYASIFRFLDTERGYENIRTIDAWALTPLHLATEVAIRRAAQMEGSVRHVFIITDGIPTWVGPKSSASSSGDDLIEMVGKSVAVGRQKGVNVVGLIIGDSITSSQATRMFGHPRYWARAKYDDLFKNLTSLVEKAFVGYLKGK